MVLAFLMIMNSKHKKYLKRNHNINLGSASGIISTLRSASRYSYCISSQTNQVFAKMLIFVRPFNDCPLMRLLQQSKLL